MRAWVTNGAGSAPFEMLRALVKRLPAMTCLNDRPLGFDDAVRAALAG